MSDTTDFDPPQPPQKPVVVENPNVVEGPEVVDKPAVVQKPVVIEKHVVVERPVQKESWIETVKTIVYALLIALVIRTFFFQPFNIPSSSMENTLLVGDYLFVEKFAYGYSRYSFPFGAGPI